MALNAQVTWCGLKEMGNLILCWIPPQLTRLFWIIISFAPCTCNIFMIPLLLSSRICVRREALALFGLREDELLPDLHITGAGRAAYRAWCPSRTSGQP